MEIVQEKNINEAIILLKVLANNTLLVVDSHTTIRYFDLKSLALLSGFKAKIKHARYKTDVVSFSNNREYFAAISGDARESRLYNLKTKKLISKVNRHQGEVSCVGIDPFDRYMFSCGDDGKTFAIDVKSGKLVLTLPHHSDTINDIAFSSNGMWIATASYDRKVNLFNLNTMSQQGKLKAHSAPIMKLCFIKKSRLISTDKSASVIVWDVYNKKVIERLKGVHDDITQLVTAENDKFLFIGTALGYILVYDLDTYELLSKQYIKLSSSITALDYDPDNHNLIIGTDDGSLLFYNIFEGEDQLESLIMQKSYDKISKLAEINPLLVYARDYDKMMHLWENTIKKAKIYLEKGDSKSAMILFKDFKKIPSRNTIIQKLFAEYKDFGKFEMMIKQGKYALAYSLANLHPMYKDSKIFQQLEARWKKTFALAQKYILEPKGVDKAKDILVPYRGITEKTKHIQELFSKGKIYKRFKEAIAQKNFKLVFELIKQNQFLKEFPEYDTIMKYADTLYIKSSQLMEKGEIHAAIKMLRVLSNFTDFQEDVTELMAEMQRREQFVVALRDKKIDLIYELISLSDELANTQEGREYNEIWERDFESAKKYASIGNVAGIKQEMKSYMKMNSKIMAIATLFSWCYITQIENAIRANASRQEIEHGIKNYLLYFGIQEQIYRLIELFNKRYPDTKLNIDKLNKGDIERWRPAMIINSILDD
jgi:hypothetical protein